MSCGFSVSTGRRPAWVALLAVVLLGPCSGATDGGVVPETRATGESDGSPSPEASPPTSVFDGDAAMEHVRAVVEIGPRPAGSEALERTRVYIQQTLEGYGLEVERDGFVADTPAGEIEMANLIAPVTSRSNDDGPAVILAGHYDTKRFDAFRFVGANDAGSSTGILLELARVLSEEAPPLPVWIVFFDGEEAIETWTDQDSIYGSRHLARRLAREGRLGEVGALILLDMVGDEDLQLVQDANSTEWLRRLVWSTAERLGHGRHFGERVTYIQDDHLPFLEAGVPSVDLIDFDYGPGNRYWHSPFDTLERVSGDSLEVVGEVVLATLPRLVERFADDRRGR